jgi:hypothetical protein
MVASQRRFAAGIKRFVLRAGLAGAVLGLSGCATMIATMAPQDIIKAEDEVACDKHRPANSLVTEDDCEKVDSLVRSEVNREARVGFSVDEKHHPGQLQLAGKFKNEDEVEKAFAIAQSVVGSEFVSPVTPGYIQVQDWQKCLSDRLAGHACTEAGDGAYSLDAKPPGKVRERYALVVGVGKFRNKIKPLDSAVKDANAVADYLTDPRLGHFPPGHVKLLTDEQATRQAISDALSDLERKVGKDDLVVVYFSSHGASPDDFGRVSILTHDTDYLFGKEKPEDLSWRQAMLQRQALWETSLSHERLFDFIRRTQSKRLLMILDVCFSGDAFSEIPRFRPTGSEALAQREASYGSGNGVAQLQKLLGGKGLVVEADAAPARRSLRHGSETVSGKFPKTSRDPVKSWGKVVISASDNNEESWEPAGDSSGIQNSYFTHFFLENLRSSQGRIQDSFQEAVPLVIDAVGKDKRMPQHPQRFAIPNIDAWNFSLNAASRR